MQNRIIELMSDGLKVSVNSGFLHVEKEGGVLANIPFHSILSVMVTGHQIVYTDNLLRRLCEENIPLIILGKNYLPIGMLYSFEGHIKQMEIQHLQIEQKKPLYKKLWKSIIQEKIKNQSDVLSYFGKENPLREIAKNVLSGDIDNKEGYAAKIYFKSLFGEEFIRNRDLDGLNSFLNYGYAVLRAALARYVVASGLNPSYGINHHNKLNPFCLVDDLIEPFRPVVDKIVYQLYMQKGYLDELTRDDKAIFSSLIMAEFKTKTGYSPFYVVLQECVWDLVRSYKKQEPCFNFNPYLIKDYL